MSMMSPQTQEVGKPEIVELLTGIKSDSSLDWVVNAINGELRVEPKDMQRIHRAVMSYKENRIRNYGENGEYTRYFAPAFDLIEAGFWKGDFERFCAGCELLLGLIGSD
ncbi:MAG: hypothetical protein KDD64_15695 [Bdellovibrionales bacterium]|nr:hypothetical protein [Bdellovibrionales bacterium]